MEPNTILRGLEPLLTIEALAEYSMCRSRPFATGAPTARVHVGSKWADEAASR